MDSAGPKSPLRSCRIQRAKASHCIGLWMKTFPDPSTSPAHRTRNLSVHGLPDFVTGGPDASGLILTFYNVVHLQFEHFTCADSRALLAAFHGFSPTVKSLSLTFTSFVVFDLVYSSPPSRTWRWFPSIKAVAPSGRALLRHLRHRPSSLGLSS